MEDKISQESKLYLDNKFKLILNKITISFSDKNTSFKYYNDYHSLIEDNIENKENVAYIFHLISKEIIFNEDIKIQNIILKLLDEFYTPLNSNKSKLHLYFKYSSMILTQIQKIILLDISEDKISQIFGNIIIKLFSNNIINEKILKHVKKYSTIFQGFCFYNMKQNQKKNQVIGILCLKELIINMEFYSNNKKYIKNLFEKIILFLDNNNFEPKSDLLELFKIFIIKSNRLIEPYINITLYKLLNYIETKDINIRRKIIDILSIIISEFPSEFQNISNSIINYLNILIKNNNNDSFIKRKY